FSRDWSSDVCSSDLLKDQGNYEEAIKAYTASKEHTHNDSLVDLADKAIADIRAIESITDYWPHHVLENYTLLNTSGIDYAPVVRSEERRVGKERRFS